jgi:16S rRNA (cytosine967-C5)-methyltransferase
LSYKPSHSTAVRMNPLLTDKESFETELNKSGLEYKNGRYDNSYIITGLSDIENSETFNKGWFAVQSESSMHAVIQAGIKPGMKLLDCCAAPGGKSAYAAALTNNGVEITAWDIHEHRVEMMKKNFVRLGVKSAEALLHNADDFVPELKESFDIVILDAPCSAMGLMSRNADIRYSRKPEDIESLSKKQYLLLSVCNGYVKPGGTLAYYTCSINKEENENATDKFLLAYSSFEYIKQETLYPHLFGSDGFYIALMKRKI